VRANVSEAIDRTRLATTALNTEWLKIHLPPYLRRENEELAPLDEVAILHVGDSKKRVTILYEIVRAANSLRQLYVGYVVPPTALHDEHQAVLKKIRVQPAWGAAAALAPEANLILSAFPNERKMALLTATELQAWMQENAAKFFFNGKKTRRQISLGPLEETVMEVLRYVPGKRFTARCEILVKPENGSVVMPQPRMGSADILSAPPQRGATSPPVTEALRSAIRLAFIAKQVNDAGKAKQSYRALRALEKIWPNDGESAAAKVRFPRALALYDSAAVVFIEALPGKNLEQALAEIDIAQVLPKVGALLASFHAAPKRVRKRVTRKNELEEVREASAAIASAFPEFKTPLQASLKTLRAWRWQDETPPALLHGTFRLNHIFIHDGQLALLDLDSLRNGHPAYDLANFLSALYYFETQGRLKTVQRRELARHFLAGYAQASPRAVAPATVLWFLSSLLINKQASKYVTHHQQHSAEKVKQILAIAGQILSQQHHLPEDLALSNLWQMLP